jgi:enoyl-CoA hydratase
LTRDEQDETAGTAQAELLRRREGVTTRLTLNRPDKANALNASLVEALLRAVLASFADGTRLLIFDGNGRHFCAGFDFTSYEELSEGDLALRLIRIETLLQAVFHAPIDTLALAHGRNFGAGADLVAACHHRIAEPAATFRMPGLRFGLVLGTRRVGHRIGSHAAREMLSTSRTVDAAEALRLGLVTRVAESAAWRALSEDAARDAQVLAPEAARALYAATTPDTRAEDMAALAATACTPGLRERIRAFRSETGPAAPRHAAEPSPGT